jgi:hypothetical protein
VLDLEIVSTVFAQREHRITSTEAPRLGAESMASASDDSVEMEDEDELAEDVLPVDEDFLGIGDG